MALDGWLWMGGLAGAVAQPSKRTVRLGQALGKVSFEGSFKG